MKNPILNMTGLPVFSQIAPEHAEPSITILLDENRKKLNSLLKNNKVYTWANLLEPLEDMEDKLSRAWSPISHMNSVVNSEALREAYNACLPKLSAYATEMGQNKTLCKAFKTIAASSDYASFSHTQKKIIENGLRDFRLSGIDLPKEDKEQYKNIVQELSALSSKFSENVLDATEAWKKLIVDKTELLGLPETTLTIAQQHATEANPDSAAQENKQAWLLTLDFPCYFAVMSYADNRNLREEMYRAFVTRASDEGDSRWDNTPVMKKIIALRHELAVLLGYENYAEYSLATKMAASTEQVIAFLTDLAQRSKTLAKEELDELRRYAAEKHDLQEVEAWDMLYYSEKLRQDNYAISQEELKPYFPADKVLKGMFTLLKRLYDLTVVELQDTDVWHKDVRFFEIRERDGEVRGQFYLDLYARSQKRGGAWMDDCIARRKVGEHVQLPVAYLVCNFSPPAGDDPALFTHDEVLTLFHEFGHGLHHMLTQIDEFSVSGISGVPWDAVELPSQFMENWCWEKEVIAEISWHYKTGESLPDNLYQKLLSVKNFQSGMQMLRQLEFSLFDFRMHMSFQPEQGAEIYEVLESVRQDVAVIRPPSFNRFPHSFAHIFAGGYAAGYYSYKWAEVLSADVFAQFEENGIFDKETGLRFLSTILEQGGSRDPMELFVEFRGREPQIDALLRHSGVVSE
ncbi:Oligopeptidase A [hydrothermal vent metagenome]|uniref:oligopeptidase A n=1 Tax=hydrothermal vent metagenome TaxID=652676 RepID=A0A3B0YYN6_9ZZZZ